jgi:hypothetical protein
MNYISAATIFTDPTLPLAGREKQKRQLLLRQGMTDSPITSAS